MEIHVFSTLAYENKKEKKGNPPNHYLDKQTYIARDTWMPSLENWGGGVKKKNSVLAKRNGTDVSILFTSLPPIQD